MIYLFKEEIQANIITLERVHIAENSKYIAEKMLYDSYESWSNKAHKSLKVLSRISPTIRNNQNIKGWHLMCMICSDQHNYFSNKKEYQDISDNINLEIKKELYNILLDNDVILFGEINEAIDNINIYNIHSLYDGVNVPSYNNRCRNQLKGLRTKLMCIQWLDILGDSFYIHQEIKTHHNKVIPNNSFIKITFSKNNDSKIIIDNKRKISITDNQLYQLLSELRNL